MLVSSLEVPLNLPLARELWMADAIAPLTQMEVPVLVLIGKKDVQVDWQADGEPLQRAAGGRENVTFLFPENANHVLKHEARPRAGLATAALAESYNGPDARLDPEALAAILAWLAART
jgi:alpha-beta hydrolase superfamily lysophospholipase